MGKIIPYTEEMLSTWRTNRLGIYALNMITFTGIVKGAENQLEYASKALKNRPALEKRAVVHSVTSAFKREMGILRTEGDKERSNKLIDAYNTFMKYAFPAN